MSLMNKLKKLGKQAYWKGFDLVHQRTHRHAGYRVHYVLHRGSSDALVVVFSAFSAGLKPTYNYVRTLWGRTDAHLLFIRDDFVNLPSGGAYYIGRKGDSHGRQAVLSLIRRIREQTGAKRVIGVGSSKGGTAALLFGCMLPMDAVIIGAPQYYIGSYMKEHKPDSLALLATAAAASWRRISPGWTPLFPGRWGNARPRPLSTSTTPTGSTPTRSISPTCCAT